MQQASGIASAKKILVACLAAESGLDSGSIEEDGGGSFEGMML